MCDDDVLFFNWEITLGVLYVVATPIGNLGDITDRARRILSEVDLIAAEDTRHTGKLLAHLNIRTRLVTYHDHNELSASRSIVEQLKAGENIALVSDAGTPLIADPGFRLVRLATDEGIEVVPIPGPSALITALSVAGLPSDRFTFYGFLPAKHKALMDLLNDLTGETGTLIFYETPHRIVKTIAALELVFGAERHLVLARELTKTFEQIVRKPIGEIKRQIEAEEIVIKGEFVLLLQGQDEIVVPLDEERLLKELIKELPLRKAAEIAARLTGKSKNELYKIALLLKENN